MKLFEYLGAWVDELEVDQDSNLLEYILFQLFPLYFLFGGLIGLSGFSFLTIIIAVFGFIFWFLV